jgi:hypothetical protein
MADKPVALNAQISDLAKPTAVACRSTTPSYIEHLASSSRLQFERQ